MIPISLTYPNYVPYYCLPRINHITIKITKTDKHKPSQFYSDSLSIIFRNCGLIVALQVENYLRRTATSYDDNLLQHSPPLTRLQVSCP